MQIRVKRDDLIRQLPYLRLPLIMEHEQGEWIYLVGEEVFDGSHPLEKLIPAFMDIFTECEMSMLKEMHGRTYVAVGVLLKHTGGTTTNAVDVHLKNIRKKIEKHLLPIEVVSHRGYGRSLKVKASDDLALVPSESTFA